MALSLGTAGSRLTANAAAVATAMGGGTSTLEVRAIAAFLSACDAQPSRVWATLRLLGNSQLTEPRPT